MYVLQMRVSKHRVLNISEPQKKKKAWNNFHSDEMRDDQSPQNIIRAITLRMMRLVGRVTRMGETQKFIQKFWWEILKERDRFKTKRRS